MRARQASELAGIRADEASAEITSLLAEAEKIARAKRLTAPRSLGEARTLFRETGDRRRELRTLRHLGDEAAHAGKLDDAVALRTEALTLARSLKDALEIYEVLHVLATWGRDTGRIDEAIELRKEQLAIIDAHGGELPARTPGRVHRATPVLIQLAAAHQRRGQHEAAFPYAERVVREVTQDPWRNSRASIATAWVIYGTVNNGLGKWESAEKAYQEALKFWSEDGNTRGMAATLEKLGRLSAQRGDLQRAVAYFDRALPLYRETNDPEYPRALLNVVWFRLELNQLAEAKQFAEEALRISGTRGRLRWRIAALVSLSRVASRRGDHAAGRAHLSSALEVAEATQFDDLKGRLHRRLGEWYLAREAVAAEAQRHFLQAYEMAARLKDPVGQVLALGGLAHVAMARSDLAVARQRVTEIERRVADGLALPLDEWRFRALRGDMALLDGRGEDALRAYDEAAQQVEGLRVRLREADLRASFGESRQKVYESLIGVAADLDRAETVFASIERAKARTFVDLLAQRRLAETKAAASEWRDKYRALEGKQSTLEGSLRALDGDGDQDEQSARPTPAQAEQLRSISIERATIVRELAARRERVLEAAAVPADAAEIQRWLPGEAVLLNYFLSGRTRVVAVVDKESVRVTRLSSVERERVLRFARLLANPQSTGWEDEARWLYDQLVAPVEALIRGKSRVIIVPHGALHYVPFQALRRPDGKFLGAETTISYLPAASALRYLAEVPPGPARTVLAVNASPASLPPLPGAALEVRAISSLFPARVLSGSEASKRRIAAEVGRHRLLHFASHGELDVEHPMRSALRFTPADGDDGRLSVDEVFDLDLRAELAVLSACSTGLGATFTGEIVAPGDELVSLGRAFLYAGARNVMVSLWPVADDATAELMKAFYGNLQTLDKAEALRKAQQDLVARASAAGAVRDIKAQPSAGEQSGESRLAHPFYWAGFILIGPGD